MRSLASSNAKAVRLEVFVPVASTVNELDLLEHLVEEHENGLQRESFGAAKEKGLQGGSQQIHDQNFAVWRIRAVVNVRDARVDAIGSL